PPPRPHAPQPLPTRRSSDLLLKGELALFFLGRRGVLAVEVAGMIEVVPRAIVFGSADPDIEIGIDPGTGHKGLQLWLVTMPRDGFRDGHRLHTGSFLESVIKAAQEFTARVRIVFPSVLAIEDDGDDSVFAFGDKRLRCLFNVLNEVRGRFVRWHSR